MAFFPWEHLYHLYILLKLVQREETFKRRMRGTVSTKGRGIRKAIMFYFQKRHKTEKYHN